MIFLYILFYVALYIGLGVIAVRFGAKFAPSIIDDMFEDMTGLGMVFVMWPLFLVMTVVFQVFRWPLRIILTPLYNHIHR
jgi:hypothetical protein